MRQIIIHVKQCTVYLFMHVHQVSNAYITVLWGPIASCGACHTIIMSTMGDLRETFSEICFLICLYKSLPLGLLRLLQPCTTFFILLLLLLLFF